MALGEIKNLQRLPHHPNLVQYKGYHFHNDAFWLFMEYCDMGDISDHYKKHYPKIPLAHQIHFMYQVPGSHILDSHVTTDFSLMVSFFLSVVKD